MSKKKIIAIVCLVVVVVVAFRTYSTQCVYWERINGEGVITDVYHLSKRRAEEPVKKAISLLRYPPEYKVTVTYDGVAYTVDDELVYNELKDMKGEKVKIEINLEKLRNGNYVKKIIAIDDVSLK